MFVSGDQAPADLLPLALNQLIESKEPQKNKELAKHQEYFSKLPFFINQDPQIWSQAKFRAFWKRAIQEECDLIVIDHSSAVQGFIYYIFILFLKFLELISSFYVVLNLIFRKLLEEMVNLRVGSCEGSWTVIAFVMSGYVEYF